jgi:hypothetical protein
MPHLPALKAKGLAHTIPQTATSEIDGAIKNLSMPKSKTTLIKYYFFCIAETDLTACHFECKYQKLLNIVFTFLGPVSKGYVIFD